MVKFLTLILFLVAALFLSSLTDFILATGVILIFWLLFFRFSLRPFRKFWLILPTIFLITLANSRLIPDLRVFGPFTQQSLIIAGRLLFSLMVTILIIKSSPLSEFIEGIGRVLRFLKISNRGLVHQIGLTLSLIPKFSRVSLLRAFKEFPNLIINHLKNPPTQFITEEKTTKKGIYPRGSHLLISALVFLILVIFL